MADPGFPLSGRNPVVGRGGAPTSIAGTFLRKCMQKQKNLVPLPGPDPGFSIGGAWTHFGGGFGLQRGHFSVKMYAKMKELGPVGGRAPAPPPRSACDYCK